MSLKTYELMYKAAEADLRELQPYESQLTCTPPIEDRQSGFKWLCKHYIKYIQIINRLGLCYDQMADTLKLRIIRKLLDASVGRLLELKNELIKEDSSDFSYMDGLLVEMKLTRRDVEIIVPPYYRRDRLEQLNKWDEEIDEIIRKSQEPPEPEASEQELAVEDEDRKEEEVQQKKKRRFSGAETEVLVTKKKEEIPPEKQEFINVITLIQRHERCRSARVYAQKALDAKKLKDAIAWHTYKPIPDDILLKSVYSIQRFWRGYITRLHMYNRDTRLRILIGELKKSYNPPVQQLALVHVEDVRRRCRAEEAERWKNIVETTKKKLFSDEQKEDIGDELRFFIQYWYRCVGELPVYPDEDVILPPPGLLGIPKGCPDDFIKKNCPLVEAQAAPMPLGGSALIVAGFWISPELCDLACQAALIAKKQNAGKKPPPKPTKEQLKQAKLEAKEAAAEAKLRQEAILAEKRAAGVYPMDSRFLREFKDVLEDARLEWRVQERLPIQAGLEVMKNIHLELRALIDDVMRDELKLLQAALDKDRSRKTKEAKKKKKKAKKKKGKKDPTKNRTTQELFEELVMKGVIKKYPYVDLEKMYGDYGYCQYDLRGEPHFEDPQPKNGDIKQVLKEFCVLNVMGPRLPTTDGQRGFHPHPVRSFLLAGPPHSGKRMMVDGVCTHLGAVKFDLSPTNLRGQFPSKKDVKMLVHLVTKMSRLLQPSVIFIDGGEKPFYKKVPKQEKEDNPRMLKSKLPKMIREIKLDDRVIFVSTSNAPWLGNAKKLVKTFDKIILVLRPAYGTVYDFLHDKLMAYHGVDRNFHVSAMAKMSCGFPLSVLQDAMENVLVAKRIACLKPKPLDPQELYDYLLTKTEEQYTEEMELKYIDWYNQNYPMAIAKTAKMTADREMRARIAAQDDKNKAKKKK